MPYWVFFLLLLTLFFLLLGSAFTSASETALFSLSPPQVKDLAEVPGGRGPSVVRLLRRPRDVLVTLLIVNIALSILIQDVMAMLGAEHWGWWGTVGVPLVLTVLFGELIPKSIAIYNNVRISLLIGPRLASLAAWLRPIRAPVVNLATWASQLLFPLLRPSRGLSVHELEAAVELSDARGELPVDEVELCRGALSLIEDPLRLFMLPAHEMPQWCPTQPIAQLFLLLAKSPLQVVLVVDGSLESPRGLLSLRQAACWGLQQMEKDLSWLQALPSPLYLPETLSADEALAVMQEKSVDQVLCVDEYGSVNGLVTSSELAAAALGITPPEEISAITQAGPHAFLVDGRAEVAALERHLRCHLPNPHQRVTVSGWLIDVMERIPTAGAEWRGYGLYAQVLAAESTRITKIYLRREAMR